MPLFCCPYVALWCLLFVLTATKERRNSYQKATFNKLKISIIILWLLCSPFIYHFLKIVSFN
jgi:bacteriorhodopsin